MSENVSIKSVELEKILQGIKDHYGYNFSEYSRASITRRVNRFMDEIKCDDAQKVHYQLTNDPAFFQSFLEKVTVNVTEMFRDPEFFDVFREKVIPRLASYPIINIWHAGCSSGEEIYSTAIFLHEAGLLDRARIYGTDINPANLDKARKGIMPLHVMKDYTTNYIKAGGKRDFSSYYTAKYNNAIISKEFREKVTFSEHSLVTDKAFNQFQVVFCRNVMIYFNRALQEKVVRLLYESLAPLGYLALGVKESLIFSSERKHFEVINAAARVFRRIN